jgi:predicted PurR-regulated permease PerM
MFGPGVPYAVLFALFIGLATAVPLAGFLFLVPAVVMTLLDGGTAMTATLVIGVYTVVQLVEMLVLTPGIMGHEVELHPVTLIVALLLCGKLVGILGLILAVPIAASGRILAREFLWPWLKQWADQPRANPKA